jgi:hypothetical protein
MDDILVDGDVVFRSFPPEWIDAYGANVKEEFDWVGVVDASACCGYRVEVLAARTELGFGSIESDVRAGFTFGFLLLPWGLDVLTYSPSEDFGFLLWFIWSSYPARHAFVYRTVVHGG